jgi:gas vesicle protein
MPKIFMPELSADERLNILRNNADKVEQTTYEKELTEDELIAKREQFVDNSIAVSKLEDELSEKKKEFKSKIDPLKLINRALQYEVKTKKTEVKGTIFHMADHVNGYMETYDESGELISSRRLRPDEKQARLYIPPKAVNE